MHFSRSTLAYLAGISTFVHSLPTATNSTLLQSGEAAQALNAQFATLTTSSPCGNLTTACVNNAIATCTDNAWDTSKGQCSQGESCFALPNLRSGGTTLSCTSPKNALSVIQSTGATGDVTGSDDASATSVGSATSTRASSSRATHTHMPQDAGSVAQATVTVTVTQPILTTPVTATLTRTISPEQAASILSSVVASGGEVTPLDAPDEAESTAASTETMHGRKKHRMMTRTTSEGAATATATVMGETETAAATATPAGTPGTLVATATATPSPSVAAPSDSNSSSGTGSGYGY